MDVAVLSHAKRLLVAAPGMAVKEQTDEYFQTLHLLKQKYAKPFETESSETEESSETKCKKKELEERVNLTFMHYLLHGLDGFLVMQQLLVYSASDVVAKADNDAAKAPEPELKKKRSLVSTRPQQPKLRKI